MKKFINKDFVDAKERLKNLGCRPVHHINTYEQPFKTLNQKRQLVESVIIVEKTKNGLN